VNVRAFILFIILTIGFILNLIGFISQSLKLKKKKPVLVKIPLYFFILYNVLYVFYILFGIIKIF